MAHTLQGVERLAGTVRATDVVVVLVVVIAEWHTSVLGVPMVVVVAEVDTSVSGLSMVVVVAEVHVSVLGAPMVVLEVRTMTLVLPKSVGRVST